MGYYVNPPDRAKEMWLLEEGEILDRAPQEYTDGQGNLAVCLVFNPAFTAAAIAYSQQELEIFKDPRDLRDKVWFWVSREKLLPVCGGKLPG